MHLTSGWISHAPDVCMLVRGPMYWTRQDDNNTQSASVQVSKWYPRRSRMRMYIGDLAVLQRLADPDFPFTHPCGSESKSPQSRPEAGSIAGWLCGGMVACIRNLQLHALGPGSGRGRPGVGAWRGTCGLSIGVAQSFMFRPRRLFLFFFAACAGAHGAGCSQTTWHWVQVRGPQGECRSPGRHDPTISGRTINLGVDPCV